MSDLKKAQDPRPNDASLALILAHSGIFLIGKGLSLYRVSCDLNVMYFGEVGKGPLHWPRRPEVHSDDCEMIKDYQPFATVRIRL